MDTTSTYPWRCGVMPSEELRPLADRKRSSEGLNSAYRGIPETGKLIFMSINVKGDVSERQGPLCPGCRKPLRANLRTEHLDAEGPSADGGPARVLVVYCRSCGLTLHLDILQPRQTGISGRAAVVEPADPDTLDGRFQIRCRDLITQIREIGFEPNVWVDMINELGATGAAKTLLATKKRLVATPWLIGRDRSDLTLEHEILELRWADLFDDDERAEAARRLTIGQR